MPPATAENSATASGLRKPFVPARATRTGRVAAAIVWGLIHAVDASLHYEVVEAAGLAPGLERPVIFAIWHNRLALSLRLYQRYFVRAWAGRRMAAIVSASRDGGLLARVLELFDVQPVRGSSSRRGGQAVLEMVSWAAQGYDLAVTPDGPRGPRCVVQDGVITVAQITGLPIVPVSFQLSRKWQLRSWDRFQIPVPFARCRVFLGPVVVVPHEAGPEEKEQLRQTVEARLRTMSGDA